VKVVLIVEDNDKNRKLVRDVSTFKGYEVSALTLVRERATRRGITLAVGRSKSVSSSSIGPASIFERSRMSLRRGDVVPGITRGVASKTKT
jgi:hypothetical protein